jgi:uncharacterized cupredoxin-like copper-binding protein
MTAQLARAGTAAFLALSAVVAGSAIARPEAPVIEIALSNFRFTPETIRLEHGRAYVLHLVNESGGGHDFTARAFFDAATIAPNDRARLDDGSVELGGHEQARIRLTAPAAGVYKVHCAHFMHGLFGMKGEIVVS